MENCASMTGDHDHGGFELPRDYADPAGRGVDYDLLGRFVGAAFDGCTPCQHSLLPDLVDDPTTTGRLVELACLIVADTLGGLPANMTNPEAPGLASLEFRRLAHAGVDGGNAAMFAQCGQMTGDERRAAASTAADLLIGHLTLGALWK